MLPPPAFAAAGAFSDPVSAVYKILKRQYAVICPIALQFLKIWLLLFAYKKL
jgi:hypothetical protein